MFSSKNYTAFWLYSNGDINAWVNKGRFLTIFSLFTIFPTKFNPKYAFWSTFG